MKDGDKNIAYFHGILRARRNKNRVENFLGISKPVFPVNNDIFRNNLSNDEAVEMVKDINDNEIKESLFDINGDKASGPDGYTLEFFKKAWEVVGNEFYLAVNEFFRSGQLLGEINATHIALIPKLSTPDKYNGQMNYAVYYFIKVLYLLEWGYSWIFQREHMA
uniref:RNA-directed DNA polymerase, eukaryota, reverse transcriptase zinc-binding domain protein n=1 Tax=Tanacetum cinerariifolium TaxID=118510 RepID=A0A6L2MYY4_TANCI|nr:RNA-directed DNA polymerase, eukaryota, reverse transcriptase zinc-binding domain protein [Tanacetum cinerariifolium]